MQIRIVSIALFGCLCIVSALRADADAETATQVLQKVVDKNRFWLDPRPKVLSYTLTGRTLGEQGFQDAMLNRVFVSADKVRWELDAEGRRGKPLPYTYVCTPEAKVCLRAPPGLDRNKLNAVRGTHPFRQGMTFETAFHEMAAKGIPKTCRVVEEIETDQGRVAVISVELDSAGPKVGLGMYHLYLGSSQWRAESVRLHVRLAEFAPIREEYERPTPEGPVRRVVSYGPKFIQVGQQLAPAKLRFVQTQPDDPERKRTGPHEWVLEGNFQVVHGLWLLDEATNTHDGKRVSEIKVSDVSVLPIPAGKFDTSIVSDQSEPRDDK